MLHLTLLLGREVVGVHSFTKPEITVGRDADLDIVIDNPSVSRRQLLFKRSESGWMLLDLGSSNGTFLGGERVNGPTAIRAGDQIGFGKYSILFDQAVSQAKSAPHRTSQPSAPSHDGTIHVKPSEVRELLKGSGRRQGAQLFWQCGDQRGVHYFVDMSAVLVGTDELCDVQVPKAPRHHILAVQENGRCRVRNLHAWARMRSDSGVERSVDLKDGDQVRIGPLELTFVADIRDE